MRPSTGLAVAVFLQACTAAPSVPPAETLRDEVHRADPEVLASLWMRARSGRGIDLRYEGITVLRDGAVRWRSVRRIEKSESGAVNYTIGAPPPESGELSGLSLEWTATPGEMEKFRNSFRESAFLTRGPPGAAPDPAGGECVLTYSPEPGIARTIAAPLEEAGGGWHICFPPHAVHKRRDDADWEWFRRLRGAFGEVVRGRFERERARRREASPDLPR